MTASVALGIAVDDTTHFLIRFRDYGGNLRNYLLLELHELLGLGHENVSDIANAGVDENQIREIPFWGELIAR